MTTTKLSVALAVLCVTGALLANPGSAHGTDLYDYKPGETLVIDHGLAPDRGLAIAAGVTGKKSDKRFCLFLVDGKSHARIGPLEEFGDPLDTGARSITAAWGPDSRHVAITYRVDRHVTETLVYRVETRRAYPVTGPMDLLTEVQGAKTLDDAQRTTDYRTLKWLSASRFVLHQHSQFHHVGRNLPAGLERLGELTDDDDGQADQTGGKQHYCFDFYGDGVCELLPGDKFRLESVQPTPVADR